MKPEYERIDRIDSRGNIREHLVRVQIGCSFTHTLCGLVLGQTQPPSGNGLCRRCKAALEARTKGYTVG